MAGSSGNLFNMELKYDGATAGKQYNGNIAEMDHTGTHSGSKVFTYGYDKLNRLLSATTAANDLNETLTYDVMGNIQTLGRTGDPDHAVTLAYTYSGNQLTGVTNSGSNFRSYGYDGNGNATSDGGLSTNTKSIAYNLFNLPQTVTKGGSTIATYTYDAAGQKLRNISTAAGANDGSWDYINGIVYHNGSIAFVSTEEGRAVPNGGGYSYQYNLKDHLGDDRVSFDGYNSTTRILQEDEYYSFGMRHSLYDGANNNRYLYNGKELQTDLTNQYDYGARFYDPVIARWTAVDPLAEKMRRYSPYNYTFDDPMRFTDPDGMGPNGCCKTLLSNLADFAEGGIQSFLSDNTPGQVPNAPYNNETMYRAGQIAGHFTAMLQSAEEMISGASATGAGVVAAPETAGLSLTVSAAGVTTMAHGAWVGKNAFVNLMKGKEEDKSEEPKLSRNEAMSKAKNHASVSRKTGEDIPMEDVNKSSRGENWEKQKANGATKSGRRGTQGNYWQEHPDGHPDAGEENIPDHHGQGHFHAVSPNGTPKMIPYFRF